MNKLVYIKSLGRTRYEDYKKFLETKTTDQLIEIKADLESRYDKWNMLITYFLVLLSISMLGFLGKFSYDFVKNAYKLYPQESFKLVKGFLPIVLVLAIFLVVVIFILSNNLANTKRKITFIESYEKEVTAKSGKKIEVTGK